MRRRWGEIKLAKSLDRDAEGYQAETGSEPREEGTFGGEVVARCGAGIFEDRGAEVREHFGSLL